MAAQKEIDLGLPPAGHARNEEFLRRNDNLAQQAEEQATALDVGGIPSKVLEPNREIRDAIDKNFLDIGAEHPYLKTKWVNYVNQHGLKVWEAKSLGWQVATTKEFPEAEHLKREDNTIRVGDVLLMCIPMDQHLLLERREADKRTRQQLGVEAEIHDLAAKHSDVFGEVHTPEISGVPDRLTKRMESRAATRRAAQRTAVAHLGNKMKEGLIPGIPLK